MKLLLADDDAARANALSGVLAPDPGLTVIRLASDTSLAGAVATQALDVIPVDMARPDRARRKACGRLSPTTRAPGGVVRQ